HQKPLYDINKSTVYTVVNTCIYHSDNVANFTLFNPCPTYQEQKQFVKNQYLNQNNQLSVSGISRTHL
ncbi:hypothetical protein, partial [Vibrio parahaemolyticus]|uniref:hypothetical protein n=1 Tax=Vibrio parahaemolyticus TaxID=670 RepID=UPI001C611007